MNKRPPVTLLGLLLLSSAAFAQQAAPQLSDAQKQKLQQKLQAADRNHDGLISRDEAAASLPMISRNFARIDKNGDGLLAPDEMLGFVQAVAAARGR